MKLALIYPPFFHKKFNENLPTVDDEFGLFPHIGFGWVAASARLAGAEVRLFDAAAIKYSYEDCLKLVKEYNPDVLCFAAHAVQTFRDMLAWAKKFKADTGLPILVGGYEAKIYSEEIMEYDCFDYLCFGEAATFIPAFVGAFGKRRALDKVPDLIYRADGRLIHTLSGKHLPFREHPMPDRSIFPNHIYYSQVSQRHNFTIGMSEVGCPYPCSFCSMRFTGFDARTAEQVVDEMEHDSRVNGIREVDWFDPIMLHDRVRAMDIAKEIRRRKLDVVWSTRSRVDSLSFHRTDGKPDEELIREIAEAGCRRLFLGLESGDDEVLRKMRKRQVVGNQKKVLDCLVAHGIRPLGFFMIGAPGDTHETVKKTIRFACTLPLEYAQFTLTMIKPHTELEKEYSVKAMGIDYWREYVRGTVEERLLPTPWTELTRADQERLARYAYLRFYLRPRYVWRMIKKIESWEEFLRYVRVALQLMLRPIRPSNPEAISPVVRTGRTFLAFIEACLAALNRGARHPVQSFGGGIRGALRLARYEWARSGVLEEVAAPSLYKDIEFGVGKRIQPVDAESFPDRYTPVSSSALGVPSGRPS
ncbi:MAG: B12-binding domain-containing radical SAM protein [Elusimicrobia bacterium]|nr:B12-binding domain-containing radical SAM protein [Elusimicrobiota bacterium]